MEKQQQKQQDPSSSSSSPPNTSTSPPSHHRRRQDGSPQQQPLDLGSDELDTPPLPLTVTSRVLYMLGDIAAAPAYRFSQWLELVRKRSAKHRSPPSSHHSMPLSAGELLGDSKNSLPPEQAPEVNLWERLGKAEVMEIESSSFSWDMLSSLHHAEHGCSVDYSEDDQNKALEVTVNSGGVVFFAMFKQPGLNESSPKEAAAVIKFSTFSRFASSVIVRVTVNSGGVVFFAMFKQPGLNESSPKEAAAVIKFSSSRIATQSERLGYEFAYRLGVRTPQARVVHNTSAEWLQIKEAAERARVRSSSEGDEVGEVTCSELLEALELSRCLYLMSYVHGSSLLESSSAFETQETAERTAAALGKLFMLDLVIRNEDRLPCRQLRWRGNASNLLLTDRITSTTIDPVEAIIDSAIKRYGPRVVKGLQKERRSTSADGKWTPHSSGMVSPVSDLSDPSESPKSTDSGPIIQIFNIPRVSDSHIVAIDSGVPRRPPAGKRANDHAVYPKLVELLLNSFEYSSNVLYEITGGKLGSPTLEDADANEMRATELKSVTKEFRGGFRAALRDLQSFHIFLLTLHQKLDNLFRQFLIIINRTMSAELDKDEFSGCDSPCVSAGNLDVNCASPTYKNRVLSDNLSDSSDLDSQKTTQKLSSGHKEVFESPPMSRESWHGKSYRGSGEPICSLRLTAKLRDFHKFAKVDAESSKDLEQCNELLKNDAVKFCQENNFNTGFLDGSDTNSIIDAYELKVRLEHLLERIALISEAANTEKSSKLSNALYIGGALAARSVYTLQHFGITHILCLCSNEIGQSESQFPDLFEYKNFSVSDNEDANISSIFGEATEYIDHVEQIGGKVLVHCFEGRSRSATVVIAYMMLRKNMTLLQAWNTIRRSHRRAQPNDGFARTLLDLDRKLHGKVSMEWHQRKPTMKVCPICGNNTGLSSSSLKLHLQKSHKRLSSGSVDSAMTMEIQKALDQLKVARGSSASPTPRTSISDMEEP